jgi:hypothetical protein
MFIEETVNFYLYVQLILKLFFGELKKLEKYTFDSW